MVKQYPYQLYRYTVTGGGVDENGFPVSSSSTAVLQCTCRDEVNSKGNSISLADGRAHVFDYLIQLPLSAPDFLPGDLVEIRNGSAVRMIKKQVQRFQRDQMHCRIWV